MDPDALGLPPPLAAPQGSERGRVVLSRVETLAFRNLADATFAPHPRINVVSGNNGQGKTSLLEAIYFAATTRSFRTSRLAEVIRHGDRSLTSKAHFLQVRPGLTPLLTIQIATHHQGKLHVRLDDKPPETLADYARRSPVVVFHPDELELSTGQASLRRRLIDRVCLHVSAATHVRASRYTRALRARQELLRAPAHGAGELDAFERVAAEEGAALTRLRASSVERLTPHVQVAFARIAASDLTLGVRYQPGGSADPDEAGAELRARRHRDAAARAASHGPHRDDLLLTLNGRPARHVASQGQHRAIALALKVGEGETIAEATGLWPILLLDDISSELDPERTRALLAYLDEMRGQLFLTSARGRVIEEALNVSNYQLFFMNAGALAPA